MVSWAQVAVELYVAHVMPSPEGSPEVDFRSSPSYSAHFNFRSPERPSSSSHTAPSSSSVHVPLLATVLELGFVGSGSGSGSSLVMFPGCRGRAQGRRRTGGGDGLWAGWRRGGGTPPVTGATTMKTFVGVGKNVFLGAGRKTVVTFRY